MFKKQEKKMIEFFTFFFALENEGDLNASSYSKISSYFFSVSFQLLHFVVKATEQDL